MNGKEKKYLPGVLRGMALSVLITIPVGYVAYIMAMIAFYNNAEKEPSVLLPKLIAVAVYFASLFFVHIRQAAEFSKVNITDEKYNLRADLIEYINTEGKIWLAVYAIIAVIYEVFASVRGYAGMILSLLFGICTPTVWLVETPILRSIVGYVLMVVLLFGITLFFRYMAHERARKKVVVFGDVEREKEINYSPMSVEGRMKKWGYGKPTKHK